MAIRRTIWTGSLAAVLCACGGDAFTSAGTGHGGPDGAAGDGGAPGSGSSHGAGGKSGNGGVSSTGGRLSGSGAAVGSGGITITPGSPISEADFRTAITSTYCDLLVNCCAENGTTLDRQRCESVIDTASQTNGSSARPGAYTFDGVQAAQCVATVRASLTSCDSFPSNLSPCSGVYTGTVPPGAPCNAAIECERGTATSVSCDSAGDGGKVCGRKRRVGNGEACTESCREQGPITYCSGSGVTSDDRAQCFANDGLHCDNGTCTKQAPLGSPCTETFDCLGEASCRLQDHTCVPLGEAGGACTSNSDCQSTLRCSAGSCVARLATGAACTSSSECLSGVCASKQCSGANLGISLACTLIQTGLPTPMPMPMP